MFDYMLLGLDSTIGILISTALITFLAIVVSGIRCYVRTPANKAFVRTGWGGRKVIVDGGAIVLPVVQEIKWISLETMQINVDREGKDALITRDKLRADVKVIFYIKVEPEESTILTASRSLGDKFLNAMSVKGLLEPKLIGALRSVSATKTLEELHQNRDNFADAVQLALKDDLATNGFTLEGVSIVELDQTPLEFFTEDNVFDAEGLRLISERVARAREEKNRTLRETEIRIARQNMEAEREIMMNQKSLEEARAASTREKLMREVEEMMTLEKMKLERSEALRLLELEKQYEYEKFKYSREAEMAGERKKAEATRMDYENTLAERSKIEFERKREAALSEAELANRLKIEEARAAAEAKRLMAEAEAHRYALLAQIASQLVPERFRHQIGKQLESEILNMEQPLETRKIA